jgi:hypothetical protein
MGTAASTNDVPTLEGMYEETHTGTQQASPSRGMFLINSYHHSRGPELQWVAPPMEDTDAAEQVVEKSSKATARQQLLKFYEEQDPERVPDLGDHCSFLLDEYSLEEIADSLEEKYCKLPEKWIESTMLHRTIDSTGYAHLDELSDLTDTQLGEIAAAINRDR